MDWQTLYQRLSNVSLEMRELSEKEFLELKAILPRQRMLDLNRLQRDRAGDERERKEFEWMKSLLKYNEMLREARVPSAAASSSTSSPLGEPRSREEAERMGFVMVRDILCVLDNNFSDYASVTRYLERHRHIRTYKPGENRKLVHAGDLIRQLASEADSKFEALDRAEELENKRRQSGRK